MFKPFLVGAADIEMKSAGNFGQHHHCKASSVFESIADKMDTLYTGTIRQLHAITI